MSDTQPFLARWVGRLLYPAALAASLALGVVLLRAGLAPGSVVAVNGVAFALLSFALERLLPETPHWRLDGQELRTDLLHALLTNTLPSALFRVLFQAALVGIADTLGQGLGRPIWPGGWPLLAQTGLALMIAELVAYAIHRFYHESALWPLHAVHHSSPRMYFLLAARKHPIQAFLTYGGRLSVLWLLGVPAEVLALYTVIASTNSYLQHANIRMSFGPLSWLLATPELHRWHHSKAVEESNANYGDIVILWDILFGTRILPGDPERLHTGSGLPEGVRVDQSYWGHLKLPFVWKRVQPAQSEGD